jgi:hypothetical protein
MNSLLFTRILREDPFLWATQLGGNGAQIQSRPLQALSAAPYLLCSLCSSEEKQLNNQIKHHLRHPMTDAHLESCRDKDG